jgi:hypothetical protein
MDFLEHVLSQEGVRSDLRKIESIMEWQNLVSIKRVWLFLGLANLYRKFINIFFALVKPFTNLWKKEGSFEWKEEQQNVFNLLKGKLSSAPMLRFLDFAKSFTYMRVVLQ